VLRFITFTLLIFAVSAQVTDLQPGSSAELLKLSLFTYYSPSDDDAYLRPKILPRGPLRVRALVRVLCPRTGSPLRWRNPR